MLCIETSLTKLCLVHEPIERLHELLTTLADLMWIGITSALLERAINHCLFLTVFSTQKTIPIPAVNGE